MSDVDLDAVARDLAQAYESRTPIPPITAGHPGLTLDGAYGIAQRQTARWLAGGRRVAGYKVGLTSAAMRTQLGVDQPDFGVLLADMAHPADAPIPAGSFLQPRAEPEVALVLGRDLDGPGLTVADLLNAVAYALPAIEIVDSRIADWRITLADTVADNASSGGYVLGAVPTPVAGLDLALLGCVLRRNGRIAHTGAGAAVLGSPLLSAVWLANTLTARGVVLKAGQVILTGSPTAAVDVAPGDAFTAEFDRLGAVTAVFA